MSKTRLEKIEGIKGEIEQLKNRQKQLQQQHNEQERKARRHRFCKRMGLFESLLPDAAELDDDQFKTFLEKTVANDYGRRTLANFMAQGGGAVTHNPARADKDNKPPKIPLSFFRCTYKSRPISYAASKKIPHWISLPNVYQYFHTTF